MLQTTRKTLVILILILIAGGFLRFYGLGRDSLENDELASWRESRGENITSIVQNRSSSEVTPPLYYILLSGVIMVVGDSGNALRFPSALSGVLSILLMFLLGRNLYSEKEGLLAASLTAVLWCPIFFSQEARVYSLLFFFTLLSSFFWINGIRSYYLGRNPSLLRIFLYLLTASICTHLHYFGLYLILLQGLFSLLIFWNRSRQLISIVILYLLLGVAYLPEISMVLRDTQKSISWIKPPGLLNIGGYARFLFNSTWLLIPVTGLFLFLFSRMFKKIIRAEKFILDPLTPDLILTLWLVIPFGGAFLISHIFAPVFTYRNLIISLPPAYLLLSRAMTQLPLRTPLKTGVILSLFVFFIGDLFIVRGFYSKPQKAQFREAVQYVLQHDSLYNNSMIIGQAWHEEYFNYYFKKLGGSKRLDVLAGDNDDIEITRMHIKKRSPTYIWLIEAHKETEEGFRDFLEEEFQVIDKKPLYWANVRLYQRKI
jgi:uncharacterized membrane protein